MTAAELPHFCSVCGTWFDGAVAVLHCARGTAPVPGYGPVRALPAAYEPRRYAEHAYSDDLAAGPGYYVYRLWSETGCLYVGMVGENGPRRLGDRLAEHRRTKSWWPLVAHIDATTCDAFGVRKEEAFQIARLHPEYNRRTEGWALTRREESQAQEWPDWEAAS